MVVATPSITNRIDNDESYQALQSLHLSTIYDADPRPTFVVDTTTDLQTEKPAIIFANTALKEHKDLLACILDAVNASTTFRAWALSTKTHKNYHRYGGAPWHGFVLQERWKVIGTASSCLGLDGAWHNPPAPRNIPPENLTLSGHVSYQTAIRELQEEIRLREHGRREAEKERHSCWQSVQRLKDELRTLEAITPRLGLSRAASGEQIPTAMIDMADAHILQRVSQHLESNLKSAESYCQIPSASPDLRRDPLPTNQFACKRIMPMRSTSGGDDASLALTKFQQLAEAVDVGFFDYDPTGTLVHANDSWYNLSGHPREPELHTPLSFSQCVYPDDRELVQGNWERLMKGQAVTFEMRWKKPPPPWADPSTPPGAQWVLAACVPVIGEDGQVKSISGCTTDINAQKESAHVAMQRAEALERARASEERFARFAEVAPIAIFRFDKDKNIEYCNDRWFEMTGTPKSRFEDVYWPFGVFEDDIAMCSAAWERAITDRSIGQIEFRLRKEWHDADGRRGQAWVYCTFFAEFSDDGSFNGLMGSLLDISHLKWAENMQKLRAEEALEAKRQQENFIDITSHEMRNPLSAMVQCADSITTTLSDATHVLAQTVHLRDSEQNTALKEIIDTSIDSAQTILSCAAHQKRIVDDILTLSKLDSNLLLITPVKTDPVEMVRTVLKMFEMDCSKGDVKLMLELSDSFRRHKIDWLMMDPSRVSQILINLLGNAIKFTTSEVTRKVIVRMSASVEPPSKVSDQIDYAPADTVVDNLGTRLNFADNRSVYLKFEVQDTGRGLTAEEKAKLFMRFSQGSPKTHVQYGGSGLGLFISRKLTEMQGGEIGFMSESSVGSTFAFYIRAERASPPAKHLSSGVPQTAEGRSASGTIKPKRDLKVLLVEDNLVNQKVLSSQLKRQGCTVFVAGHGVEALDFLKTTELWSDASSAAPATPLSAPISLDVVLMDIEMPVMGGLECTSRIRHLEEAKQISRHVPIISISANARQEQVNEARTAGVDDTITKPFRIQELMPKLNRLVSESIS